MMGDELATIEYLRQQVQSVSKLAAKARDERDEFRSRLTAVETAAARLIGNRRWVRDPRTDRVLEYKVDADVMRDFDAALAACEAEEVERG